MQAAKIDVDKQLQIAVKTGKISFGVKEATDAARLAKAKLVIIASNCPEAYRRNIDHYARQSSISVYNYAGNSRDLGSACNKPYAVAVLTVKEPGDSELLKLAVQ